MPQEPRTFTDIEYRRMRHGAPIEALPDYFVPAPRRSVYTIFRSLFGAQV